VVSRLRPPSLHLASARSGHLSANPSPAVASLRDEFLDTSETVDAIIVVYRN
jgi:hypothetical protein